MFVGVLAIPLTIVQHEQSATGKDCNIRRVQQKKNANRKHCTSKSATWNSAIHKKSATRKKVQHEKITTQKSAIWKKCSVKKVQHEKSATWKKINCHSEIRKKCTRIVQYSAQTDNGLSVDDRPLYTSEINPEWKLLRESPIQTTSFYLISCVLSQFVITVACYNNCCIL